LSKEITELRNSEEMLKKDYYKIKSDLFDMKEEKDKISKNYENLQKDFEKLNISTDVLEGQKKENLETILKLRQELKKNEEICENLNEKIEKLKFEKGKRF
jgi:chromosome segregation ATPase